MSLGGTLWRGAVVGAVVLVAQVAFALPAALAGENTRTGVPLAMLALFVGVPVSCVLLAGAAARLLGLTKPVVVVLAGLAFSAALAWLSVWLGVPHLPTTADPGVLAFGAAFALPGYTAAAVAVSSVGLLSRGIVVGLAVVVTVAGSLGWLAIAHGTRAAALDDTGVPMVVADIPGYRLESVELTGDDDRPLELHYVPVDGEPFFVSVSVRNAGRPLRTCADAYTVLYNPDSYTCQAVDGRWVFDNRDSQSVLVLAVHDNALVTVSGGPATPLVTARLRTASARELAAVTPGRH
jgi:hypothetical protein